MDHLYIRRSYLRIFTLVLTCNLFFSCASTSSKYLLNKSYGIVGEYQSEDRSETLSFFSNGRVVIIDRKANNTDVITSFCDTIATGSWELKENFIILRNDTGFNNVYHRISESTLGSKDSIRFRITFPNDSRSQIGNFKFSIIPSPMRGKFIEAYTSEFSISRGLWTSNGTFSLAIQNLAPNTDYGSKGKSRIYFNIFEDYKPANTATNYFEIALLNFNQCFYDAMDIEGDVIGIQHDGLFWNKRVFRKIAK